MKPKKVDHPTARELTLALEGEWNDIRREGKAKCPAHDDQSPSLDIEIGDNGKVLFVCRVGCDQASVLAALRRRGLWPDAPPPKAKKDRGRFNIVATYSYQLENGTEHFQVCRTADKQFLARHQENGKWEWRGPLTNRHIPYRLPELIEAIAQERPVFIVEGEKDVDNLAKLGIAATCNAGGAGKWTAEHAAHLKGADVIVLPDNDGPGRDHVRVVRETLSGVAKRVRVLELPGLPAKGDVSDWLAAGGTAEALWQFVEASAQDVTNVVVPLNERASSSTQPERGPRRADDAENRIKAHWAAEPWPEPVDGAKLLDAIAAEIERYMVLPKHAASTIALWVMHAWTIGAVDISPFLLPVSPTKRCGKTTLLTVLLYLTPRSVLASNISAAAVFRFIEAEEPTLLIDEADSFVKDNEPMRNILNSGHTRPAACVIRCEGEGTKMTTRAYSTWCPKVIAAIKELADTLMDRGIIVTLRRKQKGEKVERLRHRDNEEFAGMRRKAARWAHDNLTILSQADPALPGELDNRIADNWRPLFGVAQAAGGEWPGKARDAALAQIEASEDHDRGVMLLADIRRVFDATNAESLTPQTLVAKLIELEDAPWAEWRRGEKPITARGVAFMLKAFQIESVKVRGPADYFRRDFEEAWASYSPA